MPTLNVDLGDIALAMNSAYGEIEHFLDLETGDLVLISDGISAEDDPRITLVEQDDGSRFVEIPGWPANEGYRDMEDFIETVADGRLQEQLDQVIQGKGAFRCFKDTLLDYPQERERWFGFRNQREQERVVNWLESVNVKPAGNQAPTSVPHIFIHGFLSSAAGTKARFLADKLAPFPNASSYAIELNPTHATLNL